MDIVQKLGLIASGFERELVTSEQAKSAVPALIEARDEIECLRALVGWSYSKLHAFTFSRLDDALKLDEMKLYLEHGG